MHSAASNSLAFTYTAGNCIVIQHIHTYNVYSGATSLERQEQTDVPDIWQQLKENFVI